MEETRASRRDLMSRDRARELRNNSTKTERSLWKILSGFRAQGMPFRRQQPLGIYIVDFFCPSRKLIVELDGAQHYQPGTVVYDEERTRWLEQRGYTVLRFENGDVFKERNIIVDRILAAAKKHSVESEG
jgi:very-short-patch-repair endonuclease